MNAVTTGIDHTVHLAQISIDIACAGIEVDLLRIQIGICHADIGVGCCKIDIAAIGRPRTCARYIESAIAIYIDIASASFYRASIVDYRGCDTQIMRTVDVAGIVHSICCGECHISTDQTTATTV